MLTGEKKERLKLALGGNVFGIRIKEDGVSVTDVKPGSTFKPGDRIYAVNGEKVSEGMEIERIVKNSSGKPLSFDIIRGGEKLKLSATAKYEDGEYRLGVSLRSIASGIGTVTFTDPATKVFGGLGHGVCDGANGSLIPMESGMTTNVVLGGVKKGECGKPGELSGMLGKRSTGSIFGNTECGIFGTNDSFELEECELVEIAYRDEIKEGEAEIVSSIKNGKCERYKIEISAIDRDSTGSKSFKVKVTDPTLIAITGGIVRGMSGSPIIQDGKLVGAVTHVLVANPTEGYGIFIENMLNAANEQILPKAA